MNDPNGEADLVKFRMALLSGEVETEELSNSRETTERQFRMALLSGEAETAQASRPDRGRPGFRMALLSGEVETVPSTASPPCG